MNSCTNCGQANEDHAVFCQGCGATLKPGDGSTQATAGYGGFWKRTAAWLIDSIVVGAATGLLITVTLGIGIVGIFFAHWLYEAAMLSSSWQATLGKRALGMVVTDLQGQRLSFAHATGRHFAKWLSTLTLFIGFVMAAFTDKKQALHDMVAGTVVVNQ
jgi:uncharacterized RDD family membrane protein YckC